jgi:hypothetical protein
MENKKCSKPPTSTYIHMYIYIYMEYVQLVNHLLTLDFLQVAHKKLLFPIFKKKTSKNLPRLRLPISPYPQHAVSTSFPPRKACLPILGILHSSRWKPFRNLQAEDMVKM